MASEYISYGGVKYYSGVTNGRDPSLGQSKFDWNSKYFATTNSGPGYTIRTILSGAFNYTNGDVSGKITSITTFSRFSRSGEDIYETGSSWNIKPEYGNFSNGLWGSTRSIEEMASSVNYFYRTKDSITLTPSDGPFANATYYSSKESIKTLLNSSLFPDGWWISPFEFQLPSTSTGTSTSSVSPKATLTTTSSVDTLTGIKKKKDIFKFDADPSGQVDKVTGFNAKEKDILSISKSAFEIDKGTFAVAKNAKTLAKQLATSVDIVYNRQSGELILNANGADPGYGDDGGVFAVLMGRPNVGAGSVQFY